MSLKSAFSVFRDKIEEERTGEHAQISSLITAVFNNEPPQPVYNLIREV